jgi:ligand-binding sensor domain-containing protein
MIATERNAYLYHESGLLLHTLFTDGLDWPVFDINYQDGFYYISSYYGLYIFDEANMNFTTRVSSYGEVQSPHVAAAIDPVYESELDGQILWATTNRGLIKIDLLLNKGEDYLAPHESFRPRGLGVYENRVWVGTEIGLYSLNAKTLAWRHYSLEDGLISNFVTDLGMNKNYIWLGTNLGLTRIKWRNLY